MLHGLLQDYLAALVCPCIKIAIYDHMLVQTENVCNVIWSPDDN